MKIAEEIENLAAKEREVRQIEMLIEQVRSLNDEALAKVLVALASARNGEVFTGAAASGLSATHEPVRASREPPMAKPDASVVVLRRFTDLLKTKPKR